MSLPFAAPPPSSAVRLRLTGDAALSFRGCASVTLVRGIAPAEANQRFGKAQPYRTGEGQNRRMLFLVAIEVID